MKSAPAPLSALSVFLLLLGISARSSLAADPSPEVMARGAAIYTEKCVMCHLPAGQGAPPAFPPLAGSDWIRGDRPRLIRVLCEGLEGPVTVNGVEYNSVMPAQILDDTRVAEVLTYVTNSWGNTAKPFDAEEVAAARKTSRYPTFAELEAAASYEPLPAAPEGWTLKEYAQLPAFCTRLAGGDGGPAYVLTQRGAVLRVEQGTTLPWIAPEDYADMGRGDFSAMGLTVGPDKRLWIVSNQKRSRDLPEDLNEVTVWRGEPIEGDAPPKLRPWFRTTYPYGVGPYNHGASRVGVGPDGMLYVSSGSRTDGGETGSNPRISKIGETPLTACLWRFDPAAAEPQPEVYARGLRNPYGFDWDSAGRLFTVTNGPDADAPEEMDLILPGKHYGFPYQFSDWPLTPKPYPHTPDPPEGLTFTHALRNTGSAGGAGLATFDPHSCPAGTVWCGADFPEPVRNTFVVARFGNLLPVPRDTGFDVLTVRPRQSAKGTWTVETSTLLAPLGRPVDVLRAGGGRLLILEYTRPITFKSRIAWLPGRILELAPKMP